MMSDLTISWIPAIQKLSVALNSLEQVTFSLQLPPVQEREWYELLSRKLQPQLGGHPFLIVAVVGGTNIGKSVIFNHLAGERVSSTSPLASGTRHPTALLSEDLREHVSLERLFSGFRVERWSDAGQPLQADAEHRLFYRVSPQTPPNLIILDTPDIDSVEKVNWERADALRQSADVLIAVLTQQKYNDAAVKEFFRKAAQEGKLVLVVLNQCLLPEDDEYWPLWMRTFCEETGISPQLTYLAPNDRGAAESNQLPFYQRQWPPAENSTVDPDQPRQLLQELSLLKFEEIRTQALSGAVRHLVSSDSGIPTWLREIDDRAREFQEALSLLTGGRLVEIERWPTLPNSILIEQVRHWWREQRTGWSANIHGFYHRLGHYLSVPVKAVLQRGQSESQTPIERYRQQEWDAILDAVERCLQRLEWMKELGNPLLASRLHQMLGGEARARLLERLRSAHDSLDFDAETRELVAAQLVQFQKDRPDAYRLFRRIDSMAAAARPAISLVLFMTGAGPLGDAIAPLVTETALQSALHLAGDTVGGTVVTAVGDKVIGDAAAGGAGYLEARFRQLHAAFARRRADWLTGQLDQLLLGEFNRELVQSAGITSSPEYREVSHCVVQLQQLLADMGKTEAVPGTMPR